MKSDFLETTHPIHIAPSGTIAANEDIFNGDPESDVISLKQAHGAVFTIVTNTNAGGTATVLVYSCDDTTPTNTTPIAFRYRWIESPDTLHPVSDATSTGFLTSTGADMIYQIEVDAADVTSGYEYLQLHCKEKDNNAVDGAIFGQLVNLRYKEDLLAAQT